MPEHAAPDAPRPRSARLTSSWLIGPLLFICILSGYLLSYNVDKPTHNADWYVRYQVTCSIVERNGFNIRPYDNSDRTGPGVGGLKYSQYTLGQTTALIPLYLLGRALAGVDHTNCDATIAPPVVFLTAKLLNFMLGALLCVLFFATARVLGYNRGVALALTFLLAFGTALWPDVLSGEEHTMEALFLLAAAYAALRYTRARRKSRLWIWVMGVAAGLVFVTRVGGLIAIPIFALYLLAAHRRWQPGAWKRPFLRDGAVYAAGVLPSMIVNAAYDQIRFGSPLQTGPNPDHTFGYPPWLGIPNLLISPGKGLLWYVPALFLLPVAARHFQRRYPLPFVLFAIICGVYLLFYGNVNYWHGDPAWGPRYLYAVLPYLILPLGELLRRWRGYRFGWRALFVGTLAASFLVQFSTVTVSYWRHWHYIYAYHYDQVENHRWGQNLNYWWYPDQSPIVITLIGIYDVTQDYVTHAPLLQHPAAERLSNPYESCVFRVFGQAGVCLTDLDELKFGGNWNTFTPWWLHDYPWWSAATVRWLALALLGLFTASGGALLTLVSRGKSRPQDPAGRIAGAGGNGVVPMPGGSNGHGGNGRGHGGMIDVSALPRLAPVQPPAPLAGAVGTLVVEAPALPLVSVQSPARAGRGTTGLVQIALAALLGASVYGGIMAGAAATAPATAVPLVRTAPMSAIVHDGNRAYQVLRIAGVKALPGGVLLPAAGHHYELIFLRVFNRLDRPTPIAPLFFALTSTTGLTYPWVASAMRPAAELYHLTPLGSIVPARGVLDGVIVYLVRDGATHLELLGPGITLIRLS